MKNIHKLKSNSLYCLSGKAVAKNHFFENEEDVILAHRLINKYLSGMLNVLEYMFSNEGWILIVKTKSTDQIRKAYLDRRSKSKKAKTECTKICEMDMLSEHLRFFLSALVKAMNHRNGRTGTKVHSVFDRHIFESKQEYLDYLHEIRNEKIKLCEQSTVYKAKRSEVEVMLKKLGQGGIIFCSKRRKKRKITFRRKSYLIDIKQLTNDVLGKSINSTTSNHLSPQNTPNHKFSPQNST